MDLAKYLSGMCTLTSAVQSDTKNKQIVPPQKMRFAEIAFCRAGASMNEVLKIDFDFILACTSPLNAVFANRSHFSRSNCVFAFSVRTEDAQVHILEQIYDMFS